MRFLREKKDLPAGSDDSGARAVANSALEAERNHDEFHRGFRGSAQMTTGIPHGWRGNPTDEIAIYYKFR
jgi:hypothetical protein